MREFSVSSFRIATTHPKSVDSIWLRKIYRGAIQHLFLLRHEATVVLSYEEVGIK